MRFRLLVVLMGMVAVAAVGMSLTAATDEPAEEPEIDAFDGELTVNEWKLHKEAIESVIHCVREKGIRTDGPWRLPNGHLEYTALTGPAGSDIEVGSRSCYTDEVMAIDASFQIALEEIDSPSMLPKGIQAEIQSDAPLECLGLRESASISTIETTWDEDPARFLRCLIDDIDNATGDQPTIKP